MKSRFLPLVFLLFLAVAIHAETVRIAILNTAATEELEPILTSILSQTDGIALVERPEVDRILREHALSKAGNLQEQLSISSLLHANGLLILGKETVDKSEILSVRLTAAEPGVVIGSALFAPRKADWREAIAPSRSA